MTDSAMRDLPRIQKQVLGCISGDWKTEREIAREFRKKYPPDFETFNKLQKKWRQMAFREKEELEVIPSVQWDLDRLLQFEYIETEEKEFHKGEMLDCAARFYRLSPSGRIALLSAHQKKARL